MRAIKPTQDQVSIVLGLVNAVLVGNRETEILHIAFKRPEHAEVTVRRGDGKVVKLLANACRDNRAGEWDLTD